MTDPQTVEALARRPNKLLRLSGPSTYRLMCVEMNDGVWIGQTRGGDTLKEDIASYRGGQTYCKPLYAVFVRPHLRSQIDA